MHCIHFPAFFILFVGLFPLCVQYYALQYLMVQNYPIPVILTVGKYSALLLGLHYLKYMYN